MTKKIFAKYDKKLIPQLPRVVFPGRIIVILTPGEAERAVDFLLSHPLLGIDTETRPSFKRGTLHKVALLQVATLDICFLFRLNHIGMAPAVVRFLEDKTVAKVGLSLHDDLHMLHKLGDFKAGTFIDIQDCVKCLGIEDLSLQKLYANFFGLRISKNQQLSNWEADVLNDKQKQYAATDAWTCIHLYKEYLRLAASGDYELIAPEPADGQDHATGHHPQNNEHTPKQS